MTKKISITPPLKGIAVLAMLNHEVTLIVDKPCWEQQPDSLMVLLKKIVFDVFDFMKIKAPLEVNVLLTDDTTLQNLNKTYRGYDKPTNVLSFPGLDDNDNPWVASKTAVPLILGDIAVSYETIHREALEQQKSFEDHLVHLFVHGLLHLLGYDHEEEEEAERMEALEITLLTQFGINNPYQ